MDKDPPKWLDEECLMSAISDGGKDQSKILITNYTVKPAVESGNNYCTQLFRVKVDYQRENNNVSKSFIVKAPLDEGSFAKSVVDEAELLKNESIMYNTILPEIYAISKQEFGPRSYFCQKEDVLIMDDLTEECYIMGDRLTQLDFPHCKVFLTTLAKYHAATVALHDKNPQLIESNGIQPFYNENKESQSMKFFRHAMRTAFLTVLKNVGGMDLLIETIQSHGNNLTDICDEMFKRRGSINVLNHGDCWTNNSLFKYKEEEVVACKLIDFQIRTYGTPAIDLVYFLFTSVRSEVKEQHMDELLQVYCETLNNTLSELNCSDRISQHELQQELRHVSPWALTVVMHYLPMILNEPDEATNKLRADEENWKILDINVNPTMRLCLGKKYNEVLPSVCKHLVELGIIDYLKNNRS